ncbi:hypothetical protein HBB16_01820 [Pseudonocardia sp. MCCB 268]|nr:hypothetical protein [Pseudonocardia cytotoxica]
MDMRKCVPGSAAARFPPAVRVHRAERAGLTVQLRAGRPLLEDDPDLADVFCFSSDYPHVEGTKDAWTTWRPRWSCSGEELATKFFTKNAEWLLP